MRIFTLYGAMLLLMCSISGCNRGKGSSPEPYQYEETLMLEDLAFNRREEIVYKLGIEENGVLIPYLVLTDDYNGNCLLLREHLLDEERRYGPPKLYSAYYGDSEIDGFLNGEFLDRFTEDTRSRIEDSMIEITAKDSLGTYHERIIPIIRKAFFLSFAEVGRSGSRTTPMEGEAMSYFPNGKSRIAYFGNGDMGAWWLRTASTAEQGAVMGVAKDGGVGGAGIYGPGYSYESGVRPAFCIKGDTKIQKKGEYYVLILD